MNTNSALHKCSEAKEYSHKETSGCENPWGCWLRSILLGWGNSRIRWSVLSQKVLDLGVKGTLLKDNNGQTRDDIYLKSPQPMASLTLGWPQTPVFRSGSSQVNHGGSAIQRRKSGGALSLTMPMGRCLFRWGFDNSLQLCTKKGYTWVVILIWDSSEFIWFIWILCV
jgi:hypothetical protein